MIFLRDLGRFEKEANNNVNVSLNVTFQNDFISS